MSAPADQTRLIRKLRIALVLVAMLVGVAVIAVIGVLFYWNSYLLGSRGDDPFKRGRMLRVLLMCHRIRRSYVRDRHFCVNGCACL